MVRSVALNSRALSCVGLAALLACLAACAGTGDRDGSRARSRRDATADAATPESNDDRGATARDGKAFDPSRLRDATHEEIDRLGLQRGEYALRVNRTLVYPCQWSRADDLANVLAPLVESQYGPGTLVISHPESNYLFIQLPLPSDRRAATRRAVAPEANARARAAP